ncbi:MAG: thioredoxin domain-containing protein [Pseudobdellovibrionaceae bacterium]
MSPFSLVVLVLSMIVSATATNTFAANIPEESLIQKNYPKEVSLNQVVKFVPIAGHHFNLKAPQECGGAEPLNATPMEIQCQFAAAGEQNLDLKICDDKVTFCKSEIFKMKVKGNAKNKTKTPTASVFKPKGQIPMAKGFLVNSPDKAIAQAKKENKLIFIDFYAIWCPPCNMFDELVFEEKSFIEKSKPFVKLKLDVDSDVSWNLKSKFAIRGYPTIVVTNSDLQEIGRVVGYRSTAALGTWIDQQTQNRSEPLVALSAKKDLTTDQKKRLGEWYFETKKYDLAIEHLSSLSDTRSGVLLMQAKIDSLAKDKTKEKIDLLKKALNKFPEEVDSISWLNDLVEADPKVAAPFIAKLDERLTKMDQQTKLDEAGYTKADLYSYAGEIWDTAGKREKSEESFSKAADAYGEMARKSNLKSSRGPNLERAYCLNKAGRTKEAVALYESMVEAYPKEFTFNFSYANALNKLDQAEKALPFSEKAVEYAYGDNWLRAVSLNAKINMKLKKFDAAEKIVKSALEKTTVPTQNNLRTPQLYSQLQTLLTEIETKKVTK